MQMDTVCRLLRMCVSIVGCHNDKAVDFSTACCYAPNAHLVQLMVLLAMQ